MPLRPHATSSSPTVRQHRPDSPPPPPRLINDSSSIPPPHTTATPSGSHSLSQRATASSTSCWRGRDSRRLRTILCEHHNLHSCFGQYNQFAMRPEVQYSSRSRRNKAEPAFVDRIQHTSQCNHARLHTSLISDSECQRHVGTWRCWRAAGSYREAREALGEWASACGSKGTRAAQV